MSSTILYTEYRALNDNYLQKSQEVVDATHRISNAIKVAIPMVGAASVAVAAIGGAALKASSDFDVLTRQLTVVTGSLERAREIAKFSEDLAVSSAFFDTSQLATSARLLETFGLTTEKYLPAVETMASLFGASEEALMSFTSALGRLKAGNFGEAFERMREFGISRPDLEALGLKFDKSGSFQGSPGQALSAIMQVVQTRFGNMSEIMGSSNAAKGTTILDNAARGLRQIGDVLWTSISPAFDAVGLVVKDLVDSGRLTKITEQLVGMFIIDPQWIVDGIGLAWSYLSRIPGIIQAIGNIVQPVFGFMMSNLQVIGSLWAGMWAFQSIQRGFAIITAAQTAFAGATAVSAGAMATLNALTGVGMVAVVGAGVTGALVYQGLQNMINDAKSSVEDFNTVLAGGKSKEFWEDYDVSAQQAVIGALRKEMEDLNSMYAATDPMNIDKLSKINDRRKAAQKEIESAEAELSMAVEQKIAGIEGRAKAAKDQQDAEAKMDEIKNQFANIKVVPLLSRIANATEEAVQINRILLGGSVTGEAAFNGVNLAGASGSFSPLARDLGRVIQSHVAERSLSMRRRV